MPNYNFQNLSPYEFEDLSRDLLQKHLNIILESFTIGKDGGIDFRYSISNTNDIIIQCKKYDKFTQLISNLKKEVTKVKKKSPLRYILVTSVGLTDENKKKIMTLFSPYIQNTSDILGKDDINNLLGIFPEIEKNHFKLWLSSTNILDKILNSKTYNQSNFELEKINETINVYVDNESYYSAINIINQKKYVIISGIPGIGKTTLARILVFHFLANGFDEFIFLSDSINEGFSLFKEGIKQIFLFDDFLGTNFLENKLTNNEEQRIIKFIEKIRKSDNKILIFTTREYILSQAKQKYDAFNNPSIELAKCIIDLSQYTKLVRAKILYNHLYFSKLPNEYISNILENKFYKKIIDHKNYNPRIIETIINEDVWNTIPPSSFAKTFFNFIENPQDIWKHVFENQISNLSQVILANLMTAGTPILLNDLKSIVLSFSGKYSNKYQITCNDLNFKRSIKELENTFIRISKDSDDEFKVDYQNPSVQDFLVFYFRSYPDYIMDILHSALFFNQFFKVLSYKNDFFFAIDNRILLNENQIKVITNKIIKDFDNLSSSVLAISSVYREEYFSDYIKLNEIIKFIDIEGYFDLKMFVIERFTSIMYPPINIQLLSSDITAYINLIKNLIDEIPIDNERILRHIAESIVDIHEFEEFEEFEEILGDEYLEIVSNDDRHRKRIETLFELEIENADKEYLEDLKEEILSKARKYRINHSKFERIIHKRLEDYEEQESSYDWNKDSATKKKKDLEKEEDITIKNIFDSLIK